MIRIKMKSSFKVTTCDDETAQTLYVTDNKKKKRRGKTVSIFCELLHLNDIYLTFLIRSLPSHDTITPLSPRRERFEYEDKATLKIAMRTVSNCF